MQILPLHRTRKTVDFGHITFKNHSRLHGDKLKNKMTDNCNFLLIYYNMMVICAWLSLINGTQVRHADFDFEDFHYSVTDRPSDALWAKSIENWSMWPLLVRCHFLDASSHLYKRVCPSVCRSVCPSVGPSRIIF